MLIHRGVDDNFDVSCFSKKSKVPNVATEASFVKLPYRFLWPWWYVYNNVVIAWVRQAFSTPTFYIASSPRCSNGYHWKTAIVSHARTNIFFLTLQSIRLFHLNAVLVANSTGAFHLCSQDDNKYHRHSDVRSYNDPPRRNRVYLGSSEITVCNIVSRQSLSCPGGQYIWLVYRFPARSFGWGSIILLCIMHLWQAHDLSIFAEVSTLLWMHIVVFLTKVLAVRDTC